MKSEKKSPVVYMKNIFIYIAVGLLLDIFLSLIFALFDILDILNVSLESIFSPNITIVSSVILLYFIIFTVIGFVITLSVLALYFLYKKEFLLWKFVRVKVELLILVLVVLLFPMLFYPYVEKIFHVKLARNTMIVPFLGVLFLLFSILSLYFNQKKIRLPLYVLRLLLVIFILPVFFMLAMKNLDITMSREEAPPSLLKGTGGQKIKDLNVLLITIDTLRADKLSCYRFDEKTSPNIDRLAEKSFVFDYAFSSSNWTRPATASLFTALYPISHQTNTLAQKIPQSINCLPEQLKKAGYHTAVFTANANICPEFGFDQGVDYFFETVAGNRIKYFALFRTLSILSPPGWMKDRLHDIKFQKNISENETEEEAIFERFVQWLDRLGNEKFFAYCHFNTPHYGYKPPPRFDIFAEDPAVKIVLPSHKLPRKGGLPAAQRERLESLYYGEILFVDKIIGDIIALLRERNLFEETIIVITADHGEEFYDHRAWGHGHTMYNELLHIPLIIHSPEFSHPPARIQNHVSIIDIAPTILSLLGMPVDPAVDGKDLTPLLEGKGKNVHEFIFAERIKPKKNKVKYAVLGHGYKYIQYAIGDEFLEAFFDLNNDFGEKEKLDPGAHHQLQKLRDQLVAYKNKKIDQGIDSEDVILTEEKKDQLRSLGYLN